MTHVIKYWTSRRYFSSLFLSMISRGLDVFKVVSYAMPIDKGIKFIVESVKLGLEEILIFTTETERSGGKFLLS